MYTSSINFSQTNYEKNNRVKYKKSKENTIFKKLTTIIWNFITVFLSTSSVHGLGHLTSKSRHPVEIFIWLLFLGMALYGCITLSISTWNRYQDNPTVISMERDRFSWNTSFPSLTICPHTKMNEIKLTKFLMESDTPDKEKLRKFIVALANGTYMNFDLLPDYSEIPSSKYLQILLNVAFDFAPTVSNSGSHTYDLELIITEMGICYTYNSKLALYNSPRYWSDGRWDYVKGNETFFVHPLDGEVFSNIVNMSTGYDLYIHGPNETVDISSKAISSKNSFYLQVYVNALTLFSSDPVRTLNIRQRKCRFPYESNLPHSAVYSYTLCRVECRIQLTKKFCGCVPHFYRKIDGDITCDVKGLRCLNKYSVTLLTLRDSKDNSNLCSCLPNCDDVTYIVEDMDTREWFLGSNLQMGLKEYPRMRLKRDVLFGFTDVLVYVGGMAGLFLGCSVLSFAEIIYFFTIRLFWYVIRYGKNTNNN